MKRVLCDASVVVKWFLDEPGPETRAARALAESAAQERVALHVLDLTFYEVGNTLVVKRGVPAPITAALLDKVHAICGDGLTLGAVARAHASELVAGRGLSFYDAAYVAVAEAFSIPLASADRAMIAAGGTPTSEVVEALA